MQGIKLIMIKAIEDFTSEDFTSEDYQSSVQSNGSTSVIQGKTRMQSPTKRIALTKRQREIYEFLRDKIINRGYGPTVREIGLHFNIRSPRAFR